MNGQLSGKSLHNGREKIGTVIVEHRETEEREMI